MFVGRAGKADDANLVVDGGCCLQAEGASVVGDGDGCLRASGGALGRLVHFASANLAVGESEGLGVGTMSESETLVVDSDETGKAGSVKDLMTEPRGWMEMTRGEGLLSTSELPDVFDG